MLLTNITTTTTTTANTTTITTTTVAAAAACSATWPSEVRRLSQAYLKDSFQVYVGSLDLRVCVFAMTISFAIVCILCGKLRQLPSVLSCIWCDAQNTKIYLGG